MLIYSGGGIAGTWSANDYVACPTLYLASDVSITGFGTNVAPFIVE